MSTKRLIGMAVIALSLPLVSAAPALAATVTPTDLYASSGHFPWPCHPNPKVCY